MEIDHVGNLRSIYRQDDGLQINHAMESGDRPS
jgi:hypothetical protein